MYLVKLDIRKYTSWKQMKWHQSDKVKSWRKWTKQEADKGEDLVT